jgi:hypothetical protein
MARGSPKIHEIYIFLDFFWRCKPSGVWPNRHRPCISLYGFIYPTLMYAHGTITPPEAHVKAQNIFCNTKKQVDWRWPSWDLAKKWKCLLLIRPWDLQTRLDWCHMHERIFAISEEEFAKLSNVLPQETSTRPYCAFGFHLRSRE